MTTLTQTNPPAAERVATAKLWWVGLLAIGLSIVANGLVRGLALAVLDVDPAFMPLQSLAFLGLTTVFTAIAVIVYGVMGRFSRQPITLYRRVAVVALVLTFIPDLGLLFTGMPGATLLTVGALMVMHIVTAAITVGLLTNLARE